MLYSHWVAADSIYATRRAAISGEEKLAQQIGAEAVQAAKMLSAFYRMLVFYALVYVVVEAYRELDDRSDELDRLLNEGPIDNLRRLRNAVFHVQDEPFTPKLWDFLHTPESEKWIYRVHRGLEKFIRERLPIDATLAALRDQHDTLPPDENGA
jgi:hypothetical protein